MKELKNLLNEDNKTILIGLLSILVAVWFILYFVPSFLFSLFNTILGNLILLLIAILVCSFDIKYGLVFITILIILYRFSHLKESFTWSDNSITQFIDLQNSINPKIVFDVNEIQKQASQEEVDYFLKNGEWKWSKDVEDLYTKLLSKNIALGLQRIYAKIGICTYIFKEIKINNCYKQIEFYILNITKFTILYKNNIIDENYFWFVIHTIKTKLSNNDLFYDFNQSYIINNIITKQNIEQDI